MRFALIIVLFGLVPLGCLDPDDTRPYDEFVADYEGRLDAAEPVADAASDIGNDAGGDPEDSGAGVETCSESGDEAIQVTLTNATGENGEVFWIDYECQARPVGVLLAGEELPQGTFITHVFQLRRLDGSTISEIVVSDPDTTEYVFQ